MSIHHTLRSMLKNRKQRSVLKRIERIKYFINKGSFNEQSPVFGLPKIKSLKIKVKKEKVEEKALVGAASPAGATAAPGKSGNQPSAPKAAKSAAKK